MISAIARAMMKLNPFLRRAIFLPISLISRGRVMMPTIVRVVTKAAIEDTEAPLSRSEPASGKEIMDGMNRMEPTSAVMIMPKNPPCCPMNLPMDSFGMNACRSPITRMMITTIGKIRRKVFAEMVSDLRILLRSLDRANARHARATRLMNMAV